jgi:hypothetical protein
MALSSVHIQMHDSEKYPSLPLESIPHGTLEVLVDFFMDELIETTWLAVASPSFLPPSALYQPREEKERNQNICRCFFSTKKPYPPKTGMWINPSKAKD